MSMKGKTYDELRAQAGPQVVEVNTEKVSTERARGDDAENAQQRGPQAGEIEIDGESTAAQAAGEAPRGPSRFAGPFDDPRNEDDTPTDDDPSGASSDVKRLGVNYVADMLHIVESEKYDPIVFMEQATERHGVV